MFHSKLNEKLEELSTRLDEIALQKRLEIEAEHLKRISCTKLVRLFGSFSGSSFIINTRVLNDVGGEDKTSLWDLVKRVCVCFNTDFDSIEKDMDENTSNAPSLSSSDSLVQIFEWTKDSNTCGFVVPINESCKRLQVLIKLRNQRNIYRLSPALSCLFNKLTDTRYNIIKDIYKYVNTYKLNDYATSNVFCDENLENVFNIKNFNFNNIQSILEPHLQPIFYCVIDVDIESLKKSNAGTSAGEEMSDNNVTMCDNIWDVEVETDDLTQMPVLFPKNVQLLEKKIEDLKTLIKKTSDRIEVLKEFSLDPAQYINRKIALGSESIGTKTAFYDDLNVQAALFELIKKKEQ
ncbi:uncharacterized protein VICG_00793 [Vittaforma corneae ATCC 50505]|uniref:DM2 domain-containing protein n=1 Tax=Vittaforma corneae (strain ATCC 50505) TaxID=993615 RepID=L2GNT9_VITCO|nr:uncharacterized protein VICG_00793 [Vittaforma corneae ATCC 50505]ELA42150.1 hypothetical protein VICG_00793 [Vittaforma corneae ATCC 50505]